MTGESLGELYVDLDLRKGTFDRKVDQSKQKISSLDGAAAGLSSTMVGLGAVGLAAAGAAMVGITKRAITLGSELQEIDSKFEAVFKDEASDAEEWATSFSNSVGRSEKELKSFLSTFQDTFVPLGFSRKEGAEMSKTLTQLAVDMSSFNNKSEPETIAALQSALVGNHETMRQYGVIITQATLDQELLNMGIEGGVRAASEQEKVLARLNIIMEGTTDAQGDAARTSDEFANMSRALKGTLTDMMAEAGRKELPELTEVLVDFDEWGKSGGYDNIQDFFDDVAGGASFAAKGVSLLIQTFGDLYGVVTTQKMEVPEGMVPTGYDPTDPSTTWMYSSGMMPDMTVWNSMSDKEKLDAAEAFQEAQAAAREEIEGQNDELERQKELLEENNSAIPDWAGNSDYIRDRLDELGIEKGTPGNPNTKYNISSLWNPEDGNLNTDAGEASKEVVTQEVNQDNHFEITFNVEHVETGSMGEFQDTMSDGVQQAIASVGNPIRVPRDR